MARIKDYRSHIPLKHRRKLGQIRTTKRPGDLEIIRDPQTGEDKLYRYGEVA